VNEHGQVQVLDRLEDCLKEVSRAYKKTGQYKNSEK